MNHHFYVSNVANWYTGTELFWLLDKMKFDGYPFALWYVPVPEKSEYEIKGYAPQVPGAIELAVYKKEGRKWVLAEEQGQ